VRFEVITAVSIQIMVIYAGTAFILVDVYYLQHRRMKMETAGSSITLVFPSTKLYDDTCQKTMVLIFICFNAQTGTDLECGNQNL
jgi:hypothetical protein